MSELVGLIENRVRAHVTDYLDTLDADDERREILALGKSQQARLWEIAGQDPLGVDTEFFVPSSAAAYGEGESPAVWRRLTPLPAHLWRQGYSGTRSPP